MGDYRTTMGEEMPQTELTRRRRRRLALLVLVTLFAGIVYAGIAIRIERYATASGYVTTVEYAEVRPATTGVIASIEVSSGDLVSQGDVLVYLDAEEEHAMLEEARSRLQKMEVEQERRSAEAATQLERARVTLEEQKRNHNDATEIARLQLRNAQSRLQLTRELVEKGLKAGNSLEEEQLREQLAQAQLASLLAKDFAVYEALLERERANHDVEIRAMERDLHAQRDVVRRAEIRVRSKEIRAPIAGRVLRYEFVIGELVRPETVLYEVFGGDQLVLKLRIGERFAARVKEGDRYSAVLAPYSGLHKIYFPGKVEYLRHVIQAEGRTTYRVAYCSFDPMTHTIQPGTTAEARIYYDHSCLWYYLLNITP